MSRPLRIDYPDAWPHVMSRALRIEYPKMGPIFMASMGRRLNLSIAAVSKSVVLGKIFVKQNNLLLVFNEKLKS